MTDAGIIRETVDEADEEEQIPPDYQREQDDTRDSSEAKRNAGVSAVADYDVRAVSVSCDYDANTDPISLSESFPAGADLGQVLHDVFEVIDYTADYKLDDNRSALEAVIEDKFVEYGFTVKDEWIDDVVSIVKNVLGAKLPAISGSRTENNSFSLNRIAFNDRKNELEFNFNLENESLKNYFNGFIDLIFRRSDRYAVLDWKSDRLNDIDFTSFSDAGILKSHVDEHYSIQRVLYSYCLVKWLKNFYPSESEHEIFERRFGGVYYVFLRGCNAGTGNGIYAQTWKSWDDLKAAYDLIVGERVKKEVN
jgi:exodeoxyribonuclease V beta subunit